MMFIVKKIMNEMSRIKALKLYAVALILTTGPAILAQTNITVNSGPKVTVGAGMIMDISGDLTITSGGDFESAGTVTIGQDFSNTEGTMTITSTSETESGSLIIHGSSGGTNMLIYERFITGKEFHTLASPFAGQSINIFLDSVTYSSGNDNYAMAEYDEGNDGWSSYYTDATPGNLTVGKGYLVGRTNDGVVIMSGTFDPTGVDVSITREKYGWNLVGNPFPSAMGATTSATTSANFLGVNASQLDASYAGLYLWDHSNLEYKIINNSGATNPAGTLEKEYLQAGQGFIVKSKSGGGTINFTAGMSTHQTAETLLKSSKRPWPTLNMVAEADEDKSGTVITFNPEMTKGLDITYDAGMNKANPRLALYSRLVEDNGIDFAIQCLPDVDEELVVPLGLDAGAGVSVTLNAVFNHWFETGTVFLEDRSANKMIALDADNSSYTFVTDPQNTGIGNFYLHFNAVPTGEEMRAALTESVRITGNRNEGIIRVLGRIDQGSTVRVFDLSGRLRMEESLFNPYENEIYASDLETGIYLIQVRNNDVIKTEKLFW
jgi:hypothetical protein